MLEKRDIPQNEMINATLKRLLTYDNPHEDAYLKLIQTLESHNAGVINRRSATQIARLEEDLRLMGIINNPDVVETLSRMKSETVPCQVNYRDLWLKLMPKHSKQLDTIFTRLAGQPLFDLGGGRIKDMFEPATDIFLRIANQYGCSLYADVDRFLIQNPHSEDNYTNEKFVTPYEDRTPQNQRDRLNAEFPQTKMAFVQSDMLKFISKLENQTGNFIINGIDSFVIPLPYYHRAMAIELTRATKPGGIVIGINSECLDQLDENEFKPLMDISPVKGGQPIIFERQ